QEEQKTLTFNQLNLTANDSALTGQVQVAMTRQPAWNIDLQFRQLNLDNLLPLPESNGNTNGEEAQGAGQQTLPRPVISTRIDEPAYQGLKGFTAAISLKADSARWRGMNFTSVSTRMSNQSGMLEIAELQGSLDGGKISLP